MEASISVNIGELIIIRGFRGFRSFSSSLMYLIQGFPGTSIFQLAHAMSRAAHNDNFAERAD
jgi:hypothetical protein